MTDDIPDGNGQQLPAKKKPKKKQQRLSPRLDKVEKHQRHIWITRQLIAFRDIEELAVEVEKKYHCSEFAARRAIGLAYDGLVSDMEQNMVNDMAQYRGTLNKLIEESIADGKVQDVTKLMRLKAELLGLSGQGARTFVNTSITALQASGPEITMEQMKQMSISELEALRDNALSGRRLPWKDRNQSTNVIDVPTSPALPQPPEDE